jgi:hypothetical protein
MEIKKNNLYKKMLALPPDDYYLEELSKLNKQYNEDTTNIAV